MKIPVQEEYNSLYKLDATDFDVFNRNGFLV